MTDRTISPAQGRRIYAVGMNETEFTKEGINRLLETEGYDPDADDLNMPSEEYDEFCAKLYDDELAFKMNRDPNTPDMFAHGS